jgi:hypothetical protein
MKIIITEEILYAKGSKMIERDNQARKTSHLIMLKWSILNNVRRCTPAKQVSLAFGTLFVNQGISLGDEETVEQIREYNNMQAVLSAYSSKVPFNPAMLVHCF